MERVARQPRPADLADRALEVLEAGFIAGVAAGLGMALWLVVYGAFTGIGWLTPLKLIGGTFYRHSALLPGHGLGPLFWGLVLHLAVSAAFGILFAGLVSQRTDPFLAVVSAVLFGLVVWVVMTFAVMPVVDPFMRERVSTMSSAWFGAHVAYGVILGWAPQLRRNVPAAHRTA